MTVPTQPLSEITQEAVAVLVRELGVARTLRFLGQYRNGAGDYTADRHEWLPDLTLEEWVRRAQRVDPSETG